MTEDCYPTKENRSHHQDRPLQDNFGRKLTYLRLSLTQLCNFQCQYCLPQGSPKIRNNNLTPSEIERLLKVLGDLGIRKVRLTGGEPTLRKDFIEVIRIAAATRGIEKVACTTNGYSLHEMAHEYYKAGLQAINISLDSLDPKVFHTMTGRNVLPTIIQGIQTAKEVGFNDIKINTMLMQNVNNEPFDSFLVWVKDQPIKLRFMELMQTATNEGYFKSHYVRGVGIQNKLESLGWVKQIKLPHSGPAVYYAHPDYLGQVGLIMPYQDKFCAGCNRLRISSIGDLLLCLFGESRISIRHFLQYDHQHHDLKTFIQAQLGSKRQSHNLLKGDFGTIKQLGHIGG